MCVSVHLRRGDEDWRKLHAGFFQGAAQRIVGDQRAKLWQHFGLRPLRRAVGFGAGCEIALRERWLLQRHGVAEAKESKNVNRIIRNRRACQPPRLLCPLRKPARAVSELPDKVL